MDLGGVLENERMVSNCALSQPNLSDSRGRIGKQAGLIVGVYPGPRHYLRAIPRPDLMFESVDQGIQRSLSTSPFSTSSDSRALVRSAASDGTTWWSWP